MKKKIVFQSIIILLILSISFFVYFKYFQDNKVSINKKVTIENQIVEPEDLSKDSSNIVEDIKYFKEDIYGNEFSLRAEKGEIIQEDSKNILLINVYGVINLKNESIIFIYSKFAKYNSNSFDTKFYNNVKVNYENITVKSENLDLFFKDNYGEMYNNINFSNDETEMKADKLFFDLTNGDIKINMYDSKDKITIIKN